MAAIAISATTVWSPSRFRTFAGVGNVPDVVDQNAKNRPTRMRSPSNALRSA